MLSNFLELTKASGASLCDPIGFGKHKGKKVWEVPETYWQSFCTKNGYAYSSLLAKIDEARHHRDLLESKPARRKIDPSAIKEWFFPHQKHFLITPKNLK